MTLPKPDPAIFAWPAQAVVGRVVPKSKIYDHARPTAATRALFVSQVEQILWAYKLAPESINLPAHPAVPEIEVFEITLKGPELHPAVLRSIDKAIPFPILFNLRFGGRTQAVAAYKRPSEAKSGDWVTGDYFSAGWQPDSAPRPPLPIALDLRGLYDHLLRAHLELPARSGESLPDQLTRLAAIASQRKEQARLTARLAQERQFNRKVEINARLRSILDELDQLTADAVPAHREPVEP